MKKMNLLRNVAMFVLACAPFVIEPRSAIFFGEEQLPEVVEL